MNQSAEGQISQTVARDFNRRAYAGDYATMLVLVLQTLQPSTALHPLTPLCYYNLTVT